MIIDVIESKCVIRSVIIDIPRVGFNRNGVFIANTMLRWFSLCNELLWYIYKRHTADLMEVLRKRSEYTRFLWPVENNLFTGIQYVPSTKLRAFKRTIALCNAYTNILNVKDELTQRSKQLLIEIEWIRAIAGTGRRSKNFSRTKASSFGDSPKDLIKELWVTP